MVMIPVLVALLIGVFFKVKTRSDPVTCPQNDEIVVEDTGGAQQEPLTPSSSSPRTAGGSLFDVFLSFRGIDTRNGFTGHLHEGLHTRGISTFIDSGNLEKGEKIKRLLGYIEKSKICIPIISKGYADSKWCLRELAQMVECKKEKEVLPVFFDVDPSDVKKQSGPFASAFKKHESDRKLEEKEVRKWRKALTKVGNISGFSLKETDGDEAKLKLAIIDRVLSKLNKMPLAVATHPVGIETRLADVKKILENGGSDDVHMVGIHGMGGLGKTTIAKTVYNDLHKGFSGNTCFLSNIGEKAKKSDGLVDLQKQLIRDILKAKDISLSDVAEGVSLIKKRANRTRVLLILDDVDSEEQLEALAGGRDWFGSGSAIIITTRDEEVLLAHDMKQHEIYKPRELNEAQSWELFTRHAFKGEQPQGEFIKLSNQFVAAAGGLPLTLKVLGSHLCSKKNAQAWQDTLEKLKKIPPEKVQQRLKLSYNGLQELEKKIFLDISCFFIGSGREYATYMWEGCVWFPNLAIDVLVQRSLVKINENSGEFEMHDQLRDMGRAIVEEESSLQKRSRLWNSQDSKDLLQRKVSGLFDAEAIELNLYEWFKGECVSADCFEEMPNLRYFNAIGVKFQGTFYHFPVNLRWLELVGCHFDSLPSNFNLEKIVILRLYWTNAQIFINQWSLGGKAFEKLKVLKIKGTEIKISLDFTFIPCLVKLTLEWCEGLKKLPDSICGLSSLEVLKIRYCSTISSLPKRLGDLESLRKLILLGTSIVEIPDSIGQLKNLCELHIGYSDNLSRLPDSICQLSSLQKLGVTSCTKFCSIPERLGDMESLRELDLISVCIETIPDSIEQLSNLCKLSLKDSKCLWELPHSICQLSSLKSLNLDGCSNLCSLPERIGDMEKLEELKLDSAEIEAIPDSVGQLMNLRILSLRNCKLLKELPDSITKLSSIQQLNLAGTSLRILENIPQLASFEEVTVSSFELSVLCNQTCRALKRLQLVDASIEELPNCIGGMENLEQLQLECEILRALPNWIDRFSKKLIKLEIKSKHLNALPDCIGSLKLLENLSIECENLEALPDSIGQLENIMFLTIESANLKALPDSIGRLKLLGHFWVRCSSLETLPDSIGRLENILVLQVESANLKVLPDSIGSLREVGNLKLKCPSLNILPDSIGGLEKLVHFLVESDGLKYLPKSIRSLRKIGILSLNCVNLEPLADSLQVLESLQYLELHCDNFTIPLDVIGRLDKLVSCSFKSKNLKHLHATIGSLGRLECFSLSGCENLESLTGFSDLSSLQFLCLEDCKRLQHLPQLPSSLQSLDASGCTNLQNMSDVSDLKTLEELNLNGCRLLEDVPGIENIASNLQVLGLPGPCNFMGCCQLSHDSINKVFKNEEITFGNLKRLEMSGSIVRGSATGQQQLHFMLPRLPFGWLRRARLTLRLDKVVSPIHLAFTADDITVFEKAVEVMEGDEVELNLRKEGITTSWEGVAEKEHCYAIHVTADVSQLQNVSALLQQKGFTYYKWWPDVFSHCVSHLFI